MSRLPPYTWTLHKALKAADQLAKEGIDAEVLDLRSLRPLDKEAILGIGEENRQVGYR